MLKIAIILSLVDLSFCAVYLAPLPPIPERFGCQEGCYIKETDEVVPFGTDVTPTGYCYRISCTEEWLIYASCGVIGNKDPNCYITKPDLRKTYPTCCPTLKCNTDDSCEE